MQRKRKQAEVPESESNNGSIVTDSTWTLQCNILRAPWELVSSFSSEHHSDAEFKVWMEGRANEVMDETGDFARKISLVPTSGNSSLCRNVS
jgi:hypothetical protein